MSDNETATLKRQNTQFCQIFHLVAMSQCGGGGVGVIYGTQLMRIGKIYH
jgi:hypothetical protein